MCVCNLISKFDTYSPSIFVPDFWGKHFNLPNWHHFIVHVHELVGENYFSFCLTHYDFSASWFRVTWIYYSIMSWRHCVHYQALKMLDTILKRKSWELSPGETKPITPKMYFGFFLKNGWTLLLSVGVPILLIVVPLCLEGHTGKVCIKSSIGF